MIDDKEVLTRERERERYVSVKGRKGERESERDECEMRDDKEVLTSERERERERYVSICVRRQKKEGVTE